MRQQSRILLYILLPLSSPFSLSSLSLYSSVLFSRLTCCINRRLVLVGWRRVTAEIHLLHELICARGDEMQWMSRCPLTRCRWQHSGIQSCLHVFECVCLCVYVWVQCSYIVCMCRVCVWMFNLCVYLCVAVCVWPCVCVYLWPCVYIFVLVAVCVPFIPAIISGSVIWTW